METTQINETEMKIILCLKDLDNRNKNIHFVAGKINKDYHNTYHMIKILVAKDLLEEHKVRGRSAIYHATQQGIMLALKKYLKTDDGGEKKNGIN